MCSSDLHAYRIPGMEDGEAQELLDELLDFACQPPRTYFHDWRPGDVFMWDNRCATHGRTWFPADETRLLRRCTVHADGVPVE